MPFDHRDEIGLFEAVATDVLGEETHLARGPPA